MPELSNLLRHKLGEAQNRGEAHPDADTLTALTEQLLPAAERQQVLAHLATCGQCRDIFALSQPQLPELVTQPVIKPAPGSGWRKLFTPTFGLAATAAAMAIIAVVVLQTPHKPGQQQQPSSEAKVVQPANVAPDTQTSSTPAQAEIVPPSVDRVEPTRSNVVTNDSRPRGSVAAPPARVPPAAAPAITYSANGQPASGAGQLVHQADLRQRDFVNTGLFAANATDNFAGSTNNFVSNSSSLPAAPQPQPFAAEARLSANAGQITKFSDLPPTTSSKNDIHLLTPSQPQDRLWMLGKIVERGARGVLHHTPSVPAFTGNTLAFSTMGEPGKYSDQLQKEHPSEVATAPEKPANVTGLERFESLNSGSMATAEAANAVTVLWKVLGGKLVRSSGPGQWEDAYPGASFQFSIVSARGNDVWAGGSQASVIHSRDGGKTWEGAKLGNEASGSVVSILFSGNIVQVQTSDSQSWLSADGGKTWTQN